MNQPGTLREHSTNQCFLHSECPACYLELYTNAQVQAMIDGLSDIDIDDPCVLEGVDPKRPATKSKEKTPPREPPPPTDAKKKDAGKLSFIIWFVLDSC